ncbi:MAG TPA: RecQ family ATP-dependent DNA helicase [Longimicrobiaceae bacterium]|nr:RecQ family ATP-dependent DNA helicase [Longimicrobiaceae bacterium]
MSDVSVAPDLDFTLRERFKIPAFRPGQREVMEAVMERGAALAVFPTGGGKSLCYQLPALLLDGVTVVISPLIALMKDQIDYLRGLGIEAGRLDSSLTRDEAARVERGLRTGTLKLLYVAPERFNNERFLEQLHRARISLFAVDEAHCISEWGHNFRPDYLKLADTARELGVERVLALTATATPAVVRDICASFRIPDEAAVVTGFHRPNLFLSTHPTLEARRDATLLERIRGRAPGPGIVYVTLQKTAERVAKLLAEEGIPARAYHAGMEADARSEVQEWWKASDHAMVVATIAFGMGIDKADVRYVYHYNLPKGLESWSQEIGRAGRDGKPSVVELLGSAEDVATLENFAYGDTPDRDALAGFLRAMLGGHPQFDVSIAQVSTAHDIRQLVLRTAFTYLELLGVLKQGTPFYAGYRARLRGGTLDEVVGRFDDARAVFLRSLFEKSKFGREWYTIDPEGLADKLGQPRERIVRALEYLEEQGLVELVMSDARQRFTRLVAEPDVEALADDLAARFTAREQNEVQRVHRVGELVGMKGCQTNALLAYFGETRREPCGHCTFCETGRATPLPAPRAARPVEGAVDRAAFASLCKAHPDALRTPRQRARYLCGLTSPAVSRARIGRNPLFGVLEDRRFADVLEWCATNGG